MLLPEYDKTVVDLDDEEHKHAGDLYEAVRLTQKQLADGFQVTDLIAVPEIIGLSQGAVTWIAQGDEADPNDDAAIGARIEAVGHALVRAGQFLKKGTAPGPTEPTG